MTPSNKGNYQECIDCKHKLIDKFIKYPCSYSHRKVRGGVKYERDFKKCLLKEKQMSKITVENGVLRNIAITGIKNAEDYLLCVKYCEENSIATGDIAIGKEHRTFYDNGDRYSNFYDWERQAYSHCHLVTMDQFKQALELSKV